MRRLLTRRTGAPMRNNRAFWMTLLVFKAKARLSYKPFIC